MSLSSTSMTTIGISSVISFIFLIGVIRGAILLLKDSTKHKKFPKVIRIICGVIQLLTMVESIILLSVIYLNASALSGATRLASFMTIAAIIGFISIITSIWGAILLFTEAARVKRFAKIIRIICGIIMIVSIIMSFLVSV